MEHDPLYTISIEETYPQALLDKILSKCSLINDIASSYVKLLGILLLEFKRLIVMII